VHLKSQLGDDAYNKLAEQQEFDAMAKKRSLHADITMLAGDTSEPASAERADHQAALEQLLCWIILLVYSVPLPYFLQYFQSSKIASAHTTTHEQPIPKLIKRIFGLLDAPQQFIDSLVKLGLFGRFSFCSTPR
jgi:hypothetical protein